MNKEMLMTAFAKEVIDKSPEYLFINYYKLDYTKLPNVVEPWYQISKNDGFYYLNDANIVLFKKHYNGIMHILIVRIYRCCTELAYHDLEYKSMSKQAFDKWYSENKNGKAVYDKIEKKRITTMKQIIEMNAHRIDALMENIFHTTLPSYTNHPECFDFEKIYEVSKEKIYDTLSLNVYKVRNGYKLQNHDFYWAGPLTMFEPLSEFASNVMAHYDQNVDLAINEKLDAVDNVAFEKLMEFVNSCV